LILLILFVAKMEKRRQYSLALAEVAAPRFSGFFQKRRARRKALQTARPLLSCVKEYI